MKTAIMFALCLFSWALYAQEPKVIFPKTAGELKHLCRSYDLVVLEIELHKHVDWQEVNAASSCLNYIMGVLSTIGALDAGYFPQMKYEVSDNREPVPFKQYVGFFMKHIAAKPEEEKESAAAIVAISMMEAKILVPKNWGTGNSRRPTR
jgi:hypothetical protein